MPNNQTINLLRGLTAKAVALKQRLLYQCHTTGGMDNYTVAAFLIGKHITQCIASLTLCFHMAQHLDLRCVLLSDPAAFGAGGPNQNTPRMQNKER